jgi:hypothetical protein
LKRLAALLFCMTESVPVPSDAPRGPAVSPPLPGPWRPRLPWEPGLTVAVAAVAVVLVLLLSLALMGGSGSSPAGGGSTSVSYSSARSTGAQAAAPHGTWDLAAAIGLDLANATSVPLSLQTNCTVTSYSGPLPTSLSIPSFTGNLASGVASEWLLAYLQPSTGYQLVVAVTDGVASLVVESSGLACSITNSTLVGLPGNVVDSPTAASAVAAAGGAAFLQAHSKGVSLEMLLFSGIPGGFNPGLEWIFGYTTCPIAFESPPPTEPAGSTFSAAVNASTGNVVPHSATNGTCGGPPPLAIGSALQLGFATLTLGAGTGGTLASQGCTSGDYCYSLPITNVSDNVTPGDFEMEVLGHNGPNETEFPAVGFAILNAAGQVVVYESGPFEHRWTSGVGNPSTLLTRSMTVTVDMGTANPAGGNYFLAVTGTGPFVGSGLGVGLP